MSLIPQVEAVYLNCPYCPAVDAAVIGACASVGIEHGRSTSQELNLYLEAQHERHAARYGR